MTIPLSAVVITLNEATRIESCLRALAFCDDIVVVDSGSQDDTCALATALGARVVQQAWLGFGPQKQFAVEQARHDWVLCVDADEQVSPALAQAIVAALQAPQAQAYRFARCNRFLGRWLRHGEGYPDWSLRLFDRRHGRWSADSVHEKVEVQGRVDTLAGDLLHESQESIARYLQKQNRYTDLQAAALQARGRRFSAAKMIFSPLFRFVRFYLLRSGWRDGRAGLIHILIGCQNSFFKYAKLYEAERVAADAAAPLAGAADAEKN